MTDRTAALSTTTETNAPFSGWALRRACLKGGPATLALAARGVRPVFEQKKQDTLF